MGTPPSTQQAPGFRLADLAARTGATLHGDAEVRIDRVATLTHAGPGAITFMAHPRYRAQLAATRASAVVLAPKHAADSTLPRLVVDNPYATFARVAALLHPEPPIIPGIHPTAIVDPTALIDASAAIGAYATIAAEAVVGAGASIGAHCVVGAQASVGEHTVLRAHVTMYPRCVIGARGLIHSGAVIGADGFGHAEEEGRWLKIPQIGRVVIGNDVEIGANTTIDRGAIDDTRIEDDVKLDNQIQIGHNCVIGAHTAIAGCTGIAGSTRIGRNCKIGGAAMISGHLDIADGTTISAATQVYDSIATPGVYTSSFPALPHREWMHVAAATRRLRELVDRVRGLERAVKANNDERTGRKSQ